MIQPLVTLSLAKGATTGTNWSAVAAWAAWATVLIYIVIGLFAWRQVREARKLREEQARPFVIVDFEPDFLVYLTVENLGRTMARDVSIQFDKPLETTLERPREIDETPLFREPIPTLPPGKKIRVLFDQFPARLEAGLALTYDVDVSYKGPTGKKPWKDTYRLDLGMYVGSALPRRESRSLSPRWRTSARRSRNGRAATSMGCSCATSTSGSLTRSTGVVCMCASSGSKARRRSPRGCWPRL